MPAVDLALEEMSKLQETLKAQYPPPYEFPSDDGRVAHIIANALNDLVKIQKNIH